MNLKKCDASVKPVSPAMALSIGMVAGFAFLISLGVGAGVLSGDMVVPLAFFAFVLVISLSLLTSRK